ncbi:MAG TPA: hypothetical protein VN372_00880 [Methanospirillum sp.]|nr:hypothetical protein [Methanospirillum sp.]
MIAREDLIGIFIFGVILIITTLLALAAIGITGDMGIEERYNQAVGLPPGGEDGEGEDSVFFIEGNPVMYLAILGLLGIVCFVLYHRFMSQSG